MLDFLSACVDNEEILLIRGHQQHVSPSGQLTSGASCFTSVFQSGADGGSNSIWMLSTLTRLVSSSPRSSGHMVRNNIMIKLCLLTFWPTLLCLLVHMAVRWWLDCVSDFKSFWTKASAKRPKCNNVKYWWTNTAWTDEQSVTAWTKSHFLLMHTFFCLWTLTVLS